MWTQSFPAGAWGAIDGSASRERKFVGGISMRSPDRFAARYDHRTVRSRNFEDRPRPLRIETRVERHGEMGKHVCSVCNMASGRVVGSWSPTESRTNASRRKRRARCSLAGVIRHPALLLHRTQQPPQPFLIRRQVNPGTNWALFNKCPLRTTSVQERYEKVESGCEASGS
jgi:hypothetical protein